MPGFMFAQTPAIPVEAEIGFIEKQGQYAALDTRLINENGDTVMFGDLLGKPTLLSLVYFRCPGTCSPLMWGISKSIDAVDLKLGTDYQVLTISFDHTEDIPLGIQKKENYLSSMKSKDAAENWHFFVTDSINIAKLTQSVGFNFKWIVNQYSHPTGLIALAPDGKITRYMRGIEFLPFDIKITMIEAANGKVGPPINRLLAVCFGYDDSQNRYVFDVVKVAGILIIFFGLIIFLVLVFPRRKNKNIA
jgi:protein SCO1/2